MTRDQLKTRILASIDRRAPDIIAIGERIRAIAPRERLHLFGADGRQRIDL